MSQSTMQAATLVAPLQIEIQEVPRPVAGAGEVVVEIEGCGVCASNIPPFEGREWFSYPMDPGQLGHESWGRIVEVGANVNELKLGQRVSMLSNHAYAQFDKAESSAVVALPEELDGHPFPGEPLGCALNIFKRSGIKAGDTVAIVGIGFLGALLTKMAKNAGATVFAISRRPFSLEFARQFGADELIELDDHWRIIERVKEITGGRFCDVVIEAVGKQWPLDLSAELCRERGRLIIAGYHQDGLRQVNMQLWNWRGLDVINAHEREQAVYTQGIAEAAQAVGSGQWNPESLYTHIFPLASLGEALTLTKDRPDGFMKALNPVFMTILLTADCVGGVWTYTLDLIRALPQHQFIVATMGALPSNEQRVAVCQLPNATLEASDWKLEWMDQPWDDVTQAGNWLLELERWYAPDVVHLNGYAHGLSLFRLPK